MVNSPLFGIQLLTGGSDYPTPDSTADVKQFNDAILAMEKFLGVIICTSGTRPSSPKKQQIIVETDTGLTYYYSGSAWVALFQDLDDRLIPAGTTAQRDAFWGAPTIDSARAALANKGARWFNTTLGWEEAYYAPTGLSGLTAKGLVTGTVADWYPTPGNGPMLRMKPGSTPTVTPTQMFTSFWTVDRNRGGNAFIEPSGTGTYTIKKAGVYRVEAVVSAQAGSGAVELTVNRDSTAYNTNRIASGSDVLKGTVHTFVDMHQTTAFAANTVLRMWNVNGTYQIGISAGSLDYFLIEYLGPNLA